MFNIKNSVRKNDILELAKDKIFEDFKSQSVMITGASGLIGSELVLGFLCASELKNLDIKVIALVRNLDKAKKIFADVLDYKNFELIVQDINKPIECICEANYIIHCASVTSSFDFVKKPVDTITTAICGTKNILDYAKKVQAKGVIYLSSLEVYGVPCKEGLIDENASGYIDTMSPRSSYSESKRMCENLCAAYCAQFDLNVKVARLAQTFGAGVNIDDTRVFAQFSRCALNKTDIILYTKGETVRNYCYITDAVRAILTILIKGQSKTAYNVANPNSAISIKDLAQMLANKYGINVQYQIDNIERGYNPELKVILDTKKLYELGFGAKINIEQMFDRTISYFQEGVKNGF